MKSRSAGDYDKRSQNASQMSYLFLKPRFSCLDITLPKQDKGEKLPSAELHTNMNSDHAVLKV